jgi:ribosomal protein S12 methylthiotransferase accessory factor
MAWDITSDVGVPAVRAVIADAEADVELRPMYAAFGSGCHPDPNVALLRALTEAAQSRLTGIAGSRDDLSRTLYRSAQAAESLAYHRERAKRPGVVAVASAPAWREDTVDGDIERIIGRLAAIGLSQILVVDLGWPEVPVAVARVIVPGLEGTSESPSYAPGGRAQAAARRGGAA